MPFPSPGDLPNPGTKPRSLALQADALPSEPPGKPEKHKSPSFIHIPKFFKSNYMSNSTLGSGNTMRTKLGLCLLTRKNIMEERDIITKIGTLIKSSKTLDK